LSDDVGSSDLFNSVFFVLFNNKECCVSMLVLGGFREGSAGEGSGLRRCSAVFHGFQFNVQLSSFVVLQT